LVGSPLRSSSGGRQLVVVVVEIVAERVAIAVVVLADGVDVGDWNEWAGV
jgi:hypothetical protein